MPSVRRFSDLFDTAAGSAVMKVDGSSTAVSFTVGPLPTATRKITDVILTIHSTGASLTTASELRVFGASGALTNGLRLFTTRKGVDVDLWPTAVKKLADLYRYPGWKNPNDTVSGTADAIAAGTDLVIYHLQFPIEYPVVLRNNTADLLTFKVQDDLTGLALLEAHAIGWQFIP